MVECSFTNKVVVGSSPVAVTIDCRPGTLLKNVWQRYLGNMYVVELFLNQIVVINSRPETLDLLKRNLHQGGFLVNILEFTALLQKGLR